MIPVTPAPEPPDFDAQCRQPGNKWLEDHPGAARPKDFWSPFLGALADGCADLCSYGAMYEPKGTVDHFLDYKSHPDQSYEWTNYRFCSGWLNSAKQNANVLDPFDVQSGWFEILLPSLQLVTTDQVPPALREIAEYTLVKLHLRDDERILRQRRSWYKLYQDRHLTLEGLRQRAPLIALAVQKQNAP